MDAKNSLEEYIYDVRNKLETLSEFFDPASIPALNKLLDDAQNWLDDEGEDALRQGCTSSLFYLLRIYSLKSDYASRLQAMTAISAPALTRVKELEKLPEAEASLRQTIVHFRKFTDEYAAGSEKYKHLDAADVAKVRFTIHSTPDD